MDVWPLLYVYRRYFCESLGKIAPLSDLGVVWDTKLIIYNWVN